MCIVCGILALITYIIFHAKKPWKYGLEYTACFLLLQVLVGFVFLFFSIIMTEGYYGGNYAVLQGTIGLSILLNIGYFGYCMYRGKNKINTSRKALPVSESKEDKPKNKYEILKYIACATVITLIPHSLKDMSMYCLCIVIYGICSIAITQLVFTITALFFKKGIDLETYYAFVDGVDTASEYQYIRKKNKNTN